MEFNRGNGLLSMTSKLLALTLILALPPASPAQANKIPVISLKKFIDVSSWQLDVTWTAQDSYQDADCNERLEMTVTARFIMNQRDKKDAYGRWEVIQAQSWNCGFNGYDADSHGRWRNNYKSNLGGTFLSLGAFLIIGQETPGYWLHFGGMFPLRVSGALNLDAFVTLSSDDINQTHTCEGPLPSSGLEIHGSYVISSPAPPIGSHRPVKVAVQFTLTPVVDLAPLVPAKKR